MATEINCGPVSRARDSVAASGSRRPWSCAPWTRAVITTFPLLAVLALAFPACPSRSDAPSSLEFRLQQLVNASGAEVAVAFRTIDGKHQLLIQPDESFHAASTMKIAVMIELYRQAREQRLALDDPLSITNEFASLVDGSPFTLAPEDDSDPELYSSIGQSRSLRELCERMITVSSNLATNLLIEKLGVDRIQSTVEQLGARGMQVRRCLEDGKAYRQGISNTTTARALLTLLERIGRLQAVDEQASQEMIEILARQQFNEGIPAGVPAGTTVAHKTGQITRIHHDAALVFTPRPYALVVLVRGIEDDRRSASLIAQISREVYQFVADAGRSSLTVIPAGSADTSHEWPAYSGKLGRLSDWVN